MARTAGIKIRYWLGLLAALALSMLFSFLGVRWYTQDMTSPWVAEEAVLREAQLIRGFSNDLIQLQALYNNRASQIEGGALQRWIEQDFLPRLNGFRNRLRNTQGMDEAVQARFLATTDKMAAMAVRPGDGDLQRSANEAVLELTSIAEEHMGVLGMGGASSLESSE